VPLKPGIVKNGHPYIEVVVSNDQKTNHTCLALVDTGFSGFLSLPSSMAELAGLKTGTETTRYTLADGTVSDPVPIAIGFACLKGDDYMEGTVCIREKIQLASVGVEFIARSKNTMALSPKGFYMATDAEILDGQFF
jgi:predicted aspartyl protease